MKKLLLLLLLAALAGYVWWPYRTISRFEDAMRAGDKTALERVVDFPALRASVKETLKANVPVPKERDLAGAAGSMLAGAFLDKLVDEMLKPEVLAASLKLKSAAGSEPAALTEKSWSGPIEMTARSPGGDTLLVFRFTGASGWKLSGIRDAAR